MPNPKLVYGVVLCVVLMSVMGCDTPETETPEIVSATVLTTQDEIPLVTTAVATTGRLPKGLYSGMKVTVTLEGRAPVAVVLPKAAMLERSGRSLVFTCDEESGRAKWQYVKVAFASDERAALKEGVKGGQLGVVRGNFTLDHDSPVRVE